MREKQERYLVSFRTTEGAMAREAVEELVMEKRLDVDGFYAILL